VSLPKTPSGSGGATPAKALGAVLIEDGATSSFGTRRAGSEGLRATLVEVVDGVAHRLLAASEVLLAICGTSSPLEEARSIWERRKV
jgi:hypothetical protein